MLGISGARGTLHRHEAQAAITRYCRMLPSFKILSTSGWTAKTLNEMFQEEVEGRYKQSTSKCRCRVSRDAKVKVSRGIGREIQAVFYPDADADQADVYMPLPDVKSNTVQKLS